MINFSKNGHLCSKCRCIFGPHCFPEIQCQLCASVSWQLAALPRLHNNTMWKFHHPLLSVFSLFFRSQPLIGTLTTYSQCLQPTPGVLFGITANARGFHQWAIDNHHCVTSFIYRQWLNRYLLAWKSWLLLQAQFRPKICDWTKRYRVKLQQCELTRCSSTQAGWQHFLQLSLSSHRWLVLARNACNQCN